MKNKKKRVYIHKLPRKDLVVMCKGRGITIGHLEAKIQRLEDKVAATPKEAELYDSYMVALNTIEILREHLTDRNETIESLREDVDNADVLLAQLRRANEESGTVVNTLRKEKQELIETITELKQAWIEARRASVEHDDHWRRLADAINSDLALLGKTLDLVTTSINAVNTEYETSMRKEERSK